jgi:hypothetical protein
LGLYHFSFTSSSFNWHGKLIPKKKKKKLSKKKKKNILKKHQNKLTKYKPRKNKKINLNLKSFHTEKKKFNKNYYFLK